jgi:hypothetical protein
MENTERSRGDAPKLCPSAQPGMDNCRVLGVISHDTPKPMLLYLKEPIAATSDVLQMAAPLRPTEVFRLSATCATHKCPHFDGADCQLATRIVKMRPPAVDALPPCNIRKDCRWFSQEGGDACLRCPEVATVTYDLSPDTRAVSGLPIVIDP